jgi:mannose-1-phosphate guanylyltransferase/mannose-6-phosphate isomerase
MLAETWRRVRGCFPPSHIVVSTTAAHAGAARTELPELSADGLLVEPEARETAAAIAYAVARIAQRDSDAIVTTINADAYVADVSAYLDAIQRAQDHAVHGEEDVVLIGLPPSAPETGYGYIEIAAPVGDRWLQPVPVVRFVEKPDAETAAAYVASGRFLWNPALFTFRVQRFLALLAEYLPEHARALAHLARSNDDASVARAFAAMPKVSIDYGLMERLRLLTVLPAQFGWSDVGTWRAVHDILKLPGDVNVDHGTHVAIASTGNLVVTSPGKVVATYGIEGLTIVDTPDALLICPRDHAQGVREIVRELERRGLTAYL